MSEPSYTTGAAMTLPVAATITNLLVSQRSRTGHTHTHSIISLTIRYVRNNLYMSFSLRMRARWGRDQRVATAQHSPPRGKILITILYFAVFRIRYFLAGQRSTSAACPWLHALLPPQSVWLRVTGRSRNYEHDLNLFISPNWRTPLCAIGIVILFTS